MPQKNYFPDKEVYLDETFDIDDDYIYTTSIAQELVAEVKPQSATPVQSQTELTMHQAPSDLNKDPTMHLSRIVLFIFQWPT
uniref:Uncharacterized protein n=1 Tax=Vespula pensylvanica TaxID=30213 RepID=A0A834UEX7_VESPE|nr:hypothetical protein H0235_003228 [Vespula pensylvanica]